jgi:polyketide synthase PksN
MMLTLTLPADSPALRDHRVKGRVILPAVAYAELILLAAAQVQGLQRPMIKDLLLLRPLVIEGEDRALVLEIHPDPAHQTPQAWKVEVSIPAQPQPELLARAVLCDGDLEPPKHVVQPEAPATAAGRAVSVAELYASLGQAGLDYGQVYRTIEEVRVSDGVARGVLRGATGGVDADGRRLGMLDGALQVIAALNSASALSVPFSFGSVRRLAELGPVAHVVVNSNASKGGYDIAISNADGQIAWLFSRVQLRRLEGEPQLGFYERVWLAAAPAHSAPPATASRTLIVGAEERAVRQLASRLQSNAFLFAVLGEGPGKREGDVVHVEPGGASFAAVAKELEQSLALDGPFDDIRLLAFDKGTASIDDPERQVVELFRILRALLAHGLCATELRLELLTNNALCFEDGLPGSPAGAAMQGLCRSVAREYPRWRVRCIDLPGIGELLPAVDASMARPAAAGFDLLAWHRGQFLEERMRRVELPAEEPRIDCFREGGTYFIVGGAGGIGFALSELVASEKTVRFAWVGRRELDDRIRGQIASIEQQGGEAAYFPADIADLDSLQAAIAAARERFGAIDGVVHSALTLKDGSLRTLSDEDFLQVLRPKMLGCMNLTAAFADASLDFMLFFSSANSYWGNAKQSNYVAASAFEDAWAEHAARAQGLPTRVVNWGYWGGVGVVASDFYRKQMQMGGVGSIEADEGLEALRRVMALEPTLAPPIIAKFDGRLLNRDSERPMQTSRILPRHAVSAFAQVLEAARMPQADPPSIGRLLTALEAVERYAEQGILASWRGRAGSEASPMERSALLRTLGVAASQKRLFDACWHLLERRGLLAAQNGLAAVGSGPAGDDDGLEPETRLLADYPEAEAYLNLARLCLGSLGDVLSGRKFATELLFSAESQPLVERIYKNNPLADLANAQVADAVVAAVQTQRAVSPERPVRVLELGAGTGGTSALVLERLATLGDRVEYVYTDVSPAFVQHGRKAFAEYTPFVRFALLDLERDVTAQGFAPGDYDIVIAANVLHATRSIRGTLENCKRLLRRDGLLIGSEAISVTAFTTVTFGLLPGWWAYVDAADRLPHAPLLDWGRWQEALRATGFPGPALLPVPPSVEERLPQRVWLARSDGEYIYDAMAPKASAVAASAALPEVRAQQQRPQSPPTLNFALQARLAAIVAEVLCVDEDDIDPSAPYSDFGVDSILAVKLVEKVNETLDIELQVTDLFNFATVEALADHIAAEFPRLAAEGGYEDAPPPLSVPPPPQEVRLQAEAPVARSVGVDWPAPQESTETEAIAVIGMAGRFPGAANLDDFWGRILAGHDCVSEVPASRWNVDEIFDERYEARGKTYSRRAGLLESPFCFDPLFFNLSPREAMVMDPQQRVFLEEAWKALENACYSNARLDGVSCGVFVGCGSGDYRDRLRGQPGYEEAFALTGNANSILAARIAYTLNLRGPALAIDTACSSSLVAVHYACRSLRAGDCDVALAGGVTILSGPAFHIAASRTGMLSPQGRCRTFDSGADGFVPAEAAGVIMLKPLRAALRDGDLIHGVIRAIAVNQDGRSNGITAPSGRAQTELEVHAYARNGISAATISYVEAHGTGTRLGDPIEVDSLIQAFRRHSDEAGFCALGSVKANIGHSLAAAGIAGLLKLLLCLRHRTLPPLAGFETLNPQINLTDSPFFIPTEPLPWRPPGGLRRAAISSFGFSGTNCHLVIDEAPPPAPRPPTAAGMVLVLLSARTPEALRRRADDLLLWLRLQDEAALADTAWTLEAGRSHFEHRFACVAGSVAELLGHLRHFLAGMDSADSFIGEIDARPNRIGRALIELAHSVIEQLRSLNDPLLRRDRLSLLAELYVRGYTPETDSVKAVNHGRWVALPAYPFERTHYEIAAPAQAARTHESVPLPPAPAVEPSGPPLATAAQAESAALIFEGRWQPIPVPPDASLPGPLLVVGELDEGVKADLDTLPGVKAVHVRFGHRFAETGESSYQVRPLQSDDYRALLARLGEPPRNVLWVWNDPPASSAALSPQDPLFLSMTVAWLQAWGSRGPLRQLLWVGKDAPAGQAVASGACGLWKSAAWENPLWMGECLSASPAIPLTVLTRCLADVGEPGRHRRWIGGGLQELAWMDATVPHRPVPAWREGGVYLVSGGLGGLARRMAAYLRDRGARVMLLGRREPDAGQSLWLAASPSLQYWRCDIADPGAVEAAVAEARRQGPIRGVIHAAGCLRDGPVDSKRQQEIDEVWSGKVRGAINLDQATAGDALDLFVAFSSVAAVTGNAGQTDYACANGTLDALMQARQIEVENGQRRGHTLTLDWSYWEDGGMQVDPRTRQLMRDMAGLTPLPTQEGIALIERLLAAPGCRYAVVWGELQRTRAALAPRRHTVAASPPPSSPALLRERTERYLAGFFASQLQLPPSTISATEELQRYGIDSILVRNFNAALTSLIGTFPRTLLFEKRTVRDVAAYLVEHHSAQLQQHFLGEDGLEREPRLATAPQPPQSASMTVSPHPDAANRAENRSADHIAASAQPIAVVGMAGRYPDADNVLQFWRNLSSGKDSVTEIPPQRWDWREYFDANAERSRDGKIYAKWGAFVSDVEAFDPLFFNISPREAEGMDPQERLFLETAWATLEDAGYGAAGIEQAAGGPVGVFAGITSNTYGMLGAEAWKHGLQVMPTSLPWSIPNRVSYCLNLHGPSLAVDTACSSSLSAIHLAIASLRRGECRMALAGGVNLYLHPSKYFGMCQMRMLSATGRCRPFGEGADGFVPGEGIGAVLLKPLAKAQRDGDYIYGVLRETAIAHSGRTNGYTVPDPGEQANLIAQTMRTAGIAPERIGYVEAHGTGTALGDPVELRGLQLAFGDGPAGSCAIGSLKANIGHLESAAAIAGLTKLLLQFEYLRLTPSLYAQVANPEIDFVGSRFRVGQTAEPWPSGIGGGLRLAALSSFGAGGANGHLIVEEYLDPATPAAQDRPEVFALSARTEAALMARIRDLHAYLGDPSLPAPRRRRLTARNIAYTLQVGRDCMPWRLAMVASDVAELRDKLAFLLEGRADVPNVYRSGDGLDAALAASADNREESARLAQRWAQGENIDWRPLHADNASRRVPLPAYRFEKRHCWIRLPAAKPAAPQAPLTEGVEMESAWDIGEIRVGPGSDAPVPARTGQSLNGFESGVI